MCDIWSGFSTYLWTCLHGRLPFSHARTKVVLDIWCPVPDMSLRRYHTLQGPPYTQLLSREWRLGSQPFLIFPYWSWESVKGFTGSHGHWQSINLKLRDVEAQKEHTHGLQAVIVFMASFSRGQAGTRRVGERRGLREVVTPGTK